MEQKGFVGATVFPWQDDDANKPSKLFSNQKIKTMKLINYKETHFNLIIEKDHPLYPQKDTIKKNTS